MADLPLAAYLAKIPSLLPDLKRGSYGRGEQRCTEVWANPSRQVLPRHILIETVHQTFVMQLAMPVQKSRSPLVGR